MIKKSPRILYIHRICKRKSAVYLPPNPNYPNPAICANDVIEFPTRVVTKIRLETETTALLIWMCEVLMCFINPININIGMVAGWLYTYAWRNHARPDRSAPPRPYRRSTAKTAVDSAHPTNHTTMTTLNCL